MKNFLVGVILLLAVSGAVYGQAARTAAAYQTAPFSQLSSDLPNASVRVCINCSANASTGVCESGATQMVATKLDGAWKCSQDAQVVSGPITSSGLTMTTARLLGRTTASTGAIEEITIGSGLTLSGGSLTASGTGANTALSNLASVAINTTLVSDTNNTDDLGSSAIKWRNLYVGTAAFLPNTGLRIADTNASHNLIIAPFSNLTADRTINITTGDADRAISLGGDLLLTSTFVVDDSNSVILHTAGATEITLPTTGTLLTTARTVSTTSPLGGGGALSSNLTLTCTTCVTSAASLTSTALVTGAGSQGSQTPSATATMDSSGNISTAGSMATGVGGSVAGNIGLGQGTATSVAVNTIQHQAPTSVTGYNLVYPSAAGSGLLQWTNSTNVMTGTLSALTSGRVTFATTNGLLSDDADLTFATDTLTATKIIGSTSTTSATYLTATNCADSAGAAACGSAAAGSVVIDAAGTAVVVSTTAVTANSQIFIREDSSLNTRLSVTCNTVTGRLYTVTARTAATSFTITASAAPITDPACLSYKIVN